MKSPSYLLKIFSAALIIITFVTILSFVIFDEGRNRDIRYTIANTGGSLYVSPGETYIEYRFLNDYGTIGNGWIIKGNISVSGSRAIVVVGPYTALQHIKSSGNFTEGDIGVKMWTLHNDTIVLDLPVKEKGQYGFLIHSLGNKGAGMREDYLRNRTRFTSYVYAYCPYKQEYISEMRPKIISILSILTIITAIVVSTTVYIDRIEKRNRFHEFLIDEIGTVLKPTNILKSFLKSKINLVLLVIIILLIISFTIRVVEGCFNLWLLIAFILLTYIFIRRFSRSWEEKLQTSVHEVMAMGVIPSINVNPPEVHVGLELKNSSNHALKNISIKPLLTDQTLNSTSGVENVAVVYPFESEMVFFRFLANPSLSEKTSIQFLISYTDTGTGKEYEFVTEEFQIDLKSENRKM